MADLGDAVADRLVELDPDGAATYEDNAAALRTGLEALDQEYVDGLATCERTTTVVSHEAFSYLARYGLQFEAIAGLSPDAEPTPADLARLQQLITEDGITTVFSERLASSKMAETARRRPRPRDRGARPGRGPLGRDVRRRLPFPHGPEPRRAPEGQRMPVTPEHLRSRVRDGSVAIGGRPILRGIDLTVRSGEFLALMGANGSGKSTLVRAITGLLPTTGGGISLFGTPYADFRDWKRVGFVPQRASAASGVPATVWEVVASGRIRRRRPFLPLSREDRRAIADAIDVVGLSDRTGLGVSQLSGGQQQRVLIARALAGEPDLLVLDEPTAGVDLGNQRALADALAHLQGRGATIVLVAHELGPMAPLIDRAVVMRDGRIAYDGPALDEEDRPTHEALTTPPAPRARPRPARGIAARRAGGR